MSYILSRIARLLLRLGGWTLVGEPPAVKKAVLIAAPHTSNWDGVWGLIARVAMRVDIHFFAKKSLFWFPLSVLLRVLGGVPLDREQAGSAVTQAVAMFNSNDSYYFGLAPEGTRKRKDYWKTGFYRIAEQAGVPIVLGFFDYDNRRLGLGPTYELSGDRERDLSFIGEFYASASGRWPDKVTPVGFPPDA